MADPIWKSIAAEITARIASGDLEPGAKIPSGDILARERGVSRNAAHRAIEELQREGLVVRRQGSGTVVADRAQAKPVRVALLVDGYSPIHNFPSGELLRGLQDRIGESGSLVIADSKHDVELENRQLEKLSKEVDGIVLYPTGHDSSALRGLVEEGYPIVALDRVPQGVPVSAAITDNRAAAHRAVRALIERGHRKVGFLAFHKPHYSSVAERLAGYRDAMVEAGAENDELVRWLPEGSDLVLPIFQQVVRDTLLALRQGDDAITALFCVEDQIGCAAVLGCERLGLTLPEDLEIASFSDWHPMTLRTPWNVHRLIQKKYELGLAAAGLLLDRIASPRRDVSVIRVDVDFILADAGLQEALVSLTL